MLTVAIWVESFRCARVLLLQWQGENFGHQQHFKFCHFQPVHCGSRNPISPKVFNRFLKCLPQLEDCEGGHLGWKFQARRYFTFAMARWKLGASTTFEIMLLSTCTLCKQKSYISKGIQPIFEIFASARRGWRWPFGWKVSGAHVFYFCNGEVRTLRIEKILNFGTFNLYTVQGQNHYLQRYSTDFRKLYLSSQMLTVAFWVEIFMCARVLLLQWQGENLRINNILNFATFNLYTVQAEILYLQRYSTDFRNLSVSSKMLRVAIGWKVSSAHVFYFCNGKVKTFRIDNTWNYATFNLYTVQAKILYLHGIQPIFEMFASTRRLWGWHLCGKFQARMCFTFAMARWKLGASTTFEILPLSTCTLFKQKSYISKDIQPIFEIVPKARRCWRWPFGWNVSGAQESYLCNGKVETLRNDNIRNFATFSLYPVQAEMLYLQRYSTIFEIFASARRCWAWAFGWKVLGAQVYYFCHDRWNFAHRHHLKFCYFQKYTVPAKILYHQRHSNDFRNLSNSSRMLKVDIWVKSLRCAGILLLQWQGENLAYRQHLKFWHYQPVHCASKNPISPKVFIRFSKSFRQLEDVEGGHLGGKFYVRRYITFAMTRWNFAHRHHLKFCYFQPVHCASKNPISPKVFNDFWNVCLNSKMLRVGICLESFRCAGFLLLQWKGENMAHRQHLKFCLFQPVHCARKSLMLQRYSADFPNLCLSSRMLRWAFGWEGSAAQVFYFCNGKVKLCASTTSEILLLSTCTLCKQKSNISKDIQPIFEIFPSARRCWR